MQHAVSGTINDKYADNDISKLNKMYTLSAAERCEEQNLETIINTIIHR
jgi:hypothetical protein